MQRKEKRPLTIQREIFLLTFLALISVSLLFAGIFLKLRYDDSIASAKSSLRECNSQIVTYTEGMFHENATVVDILSRDEAVIQGGQGSQKAALEIFQAIHRNNANITYIYSGYQDGTLLINDYQAPVDYQAKTRPWYQAAAQTDGVAQLVYRDAATNMWLFSQCKKIVNTRGTMIGAVAIDCSNENITQQLSTKYQYESQRSYIVDAAGTVLIHPDDVEVNTSMREVMESITWNSIANGHSNYAEYNNNGTQAMAYFERIPQTDFIVVTAINADEVIKPIVGSMVALLLVIVAISILLGLLLSRVFIRRFAKPIVELGERIRNLADGRPGDAKDMRFSNAEINSIAEHIEVLVKDIANREEQRKAAEYLSFHDSMTGLYNRRFFEEELRRLDVKRNYPLTLVCCDINGLKLVNDVFGHALGDRVLTIVSACLERGCRADDILARIGGDEFAVILPHTTEADAKQVIMRMTASFPDSSICGAEVSASLGFASKENQSQTLESVLQAADAMMYDHKIKESVEMKRRTVGNIIAAAESERLIGPPNALEEQLLDRFATALCPDSRALLLESYRLRRIGRCTLVPSVEYSYDALSKRHTEAGYRILSALEEYRVVAGFVLHYLEHWNGSGWPAGLSGHDIPLLSRIMAVVDACADGRGVQALAQESGKQYDPELVAMLPAFLEE